MIVWVKSHSSSQHMKGEILSSWKIWDSIRRRQKRTGIRQKTSLSCDIYIDDAFAVSHRAAASNSAITEFVKTCGAGFLLKNEIEYFNKAWEIRRGRFAPYRRRKGSDKIGVLEKLIDKVDKLIVGGAWLYFLKRQVTASANLCASPICSIWRERLRKKPNRKMCSFYCRWIVWLQKSNSRCRSKNMRHQKHAWRLDGTDIGRQQFSVLDALQGVKNYRLERPLACLSLRFQQRNILAGQCRGEFRGASIIGGGDTDTAIHKAGQSAKMSYISPAAARFWNYWKEKLYPELRAGKIREKKMREWIVAGNWKMHNTIADQSR